MPTVDRTICSIYNRNSVRQYCQAAEEDQQSFSDSEESKSLSKSEMDRERALSLVGDTDSSLSVKEWKELQDKFLESDNGKTWNFDKLVMRSIVKLGYYKMGQSFFSVLKKRRENNI